MTAVDQVGYVTIGLNGPNEKIVSVRINNVKASATDQDVYDVVTSIVGLLQYTVNNIMRNKRTLLTA
jgi:hypothetical protein